MGRPRAPGLGRTSQRCAFALVVRQRRGLPGRTRRRAGRGRLRVGAGGTRGIRGRGTGRSVGASRLPHPRNRGGGGPVLQISRRPGRPRRRDRRLTRHAGRGGVDQRVRVREGAPRRSGRAPASLRRGLLRRRLHELRRRPLRRKPRSPVCRRGESARSGRGLRLFGSASRAMDVPRLADEARHDRHDVLLLVRSLRRARGRRRTGLRRMPPHAERAHERPDGRGLRDRTRVGA